jgi:hypothetical protein
LRVVKWTRKEKITTSFLRLGGRSTVSLEVSKGIGKFSWEWNVPL